MPVTEKMKAKSSHKEPVVVDRNNFASLGFRAKMTAHASD